jgi:MinD superfamily P-loop ATPase
MTTPNAVLELDTTRCDGCGFCVATCPTNCLEQLGAVVWLPRPTDCVQCAICELVCPTAAIQLPVPASTGPLSFAPR